MKDSTSPDSGMVYIFERDTGGANAWGEVGKLTASDGSAYDRFGCSVSGDGNVLLIGASHGDGVETDSGAVYIFEHEPFESALPERPVRTLEP